MQVAKRLMELGTENAFAVIPTINALKAMGRDIKSFSIGEPDFNTPEHIKEAAIKAIKENKTHYCASQGQLDFREAIARHVSKTRGIEVKAQNIVVTPGAKITICYAIMCTINPGDEVIYPNPGYPIYESMIKFFGGKAVPLPLWEERGFRFDPKELEKLVTKKTRMIILNSPQNPTGGVLTEEDLKSVAALARKHDLWVLSDEIYGGLVYEGEHKSIMSLPGMLDRTILLDGHSKFYAMTGWRLGYAYVPDAIVQHFVRLVINYNANVTTFIQPAGIAALEGPQTESLKMKKEFHERRDLIVKLLNEVPGFKCHKPNGAFYVMPNVTKAVKDLGFKNSKDLQEYLLFMANVAVLSRTYFGCRNKGEKDDYIRLSYASSKEDIKEGLKRIKEAVVNKEQAAYFLKNHDKCTECTYK